MRLHPCICGEDEFHPSSTIDLTDGVWVVHYEGICESCGHPRAFQFRQPEEIVVPEDGQWAVGDQPSELLDAGEWRRVADLYGGGPADGGPSPDPEEARGDLLAAAAALDEVLKFLPPGADVIPESAFWTQVGRQVRLAEPGRFWRVRLEAARDVYRRLAAEAGGSR